MQKINTTLILILIVNFSNAQFISGLNADIRLDDKNLHTIDNTKLLYDFSKMTGIPCNPNTFWAATSSGQVLEFQINGSTVIYNGITVASTPVNSYIPLAFGNNITGNLFSPTFYSSDYSNTAYYFDGISWVTMIGNSSCQLFNASANGNNLFYQFNGVSPYCIEEYTGTGFNQIYTDSVMHFTVADMAVDNVNNIWCFMGDSLPTLTQYIKVLSSTGALIKQYSFLLNTNNAYGCFLLNSILYIGLGTSNPTYPNSILPLSFTSNSVNVGLPLLMSFTNLTDMASCEPGEPLSVLQLNPVDILFNIFPNPASTNLTVILKKKENITIYNVLGETILHKKVLSSSNGKEELDISSLPSGIYFIKAGNEVRKFVKE
ncbi:MAG TPA: T9SS type A sorting domain-containing protein [Bacteroidia bacterium]|nr:T9SS type A sorting domain-containing protein [Bacteroidia bacterium]